LTPQRWTQMYSQHWDYLNAVLTPEQLQVWQQLTGERYVFPPNVFVPGTNSAANGTTGGNSIGSTSLDQSGTTNNAASIPPQQREASVEGTAPSRDPGK